MKRLVIILFVLFSASAFSQNPEWMYYTEGTQTETIAEDGDYLWIGASGGLVKMSKANSEMKFFKSSNSGLRENDIIEIEIDKQGDKLGETEFQKNKTLSWVSSGFALSDYITLKENFNCSFKNILYKKVLVFYRNDNIWIMDFDGGNQKQIFKTGNNFWHTFKLTNDRTKFSYSSKGKFYISTFDGKILYEINDIPNYSNTVEISPDGNKLALIKADEKLTAAEASKIVSKGYNPEYFKEGNPIKTGIYIYDLVTKKEKKLVGKLPDKLTSREIYDKSKWLDYGLYWSPDGKRLHFERVYDIYAETEVYGDCYIINIENGELEYLGHPGYIVNWVYNKIIYDGEGIYNVFDISSKRFSENYENLVRNYEFFYYLTSSKDKCLFSALKDNNIDLFIYDVRADRLKKIAKVKGFKVVANFSSDGTKVIYGNSDNIWIYDITLDEKYILPIPLPKPWSLYNILWETNENKIILLINDSVWSISPDGSKLKQLTTNAGLDFLDWAIIPYSSIESQNKRK